jgi:hypothetical protein
MRNRVRKLSKFVPAKDLLSAGVVSCSEWVARLYIDMFGRLLVEKQHVQAIVLAEIELGTYESLVCLHVKRRFVLLQSHRIE